MKKNVPSVGEPKNQGCIEMAKILIGLPKIKKLTTGEKNPSAQTSFISPSEGKKVLNGNPNGFLLRRAKIVLNAISTRPDKHNLPYPQNLTYSIRYETFTYILIPRQLAAR